MTVPRIAACVIVSAALLGACSKPAGAPSSASNAAAQLGPNLSARPPATAHKACALLTQADAEAAVGQPLPNTLVNPMSSACDYDAADFTASASLIVGTWDSIDALATQGEHKSAPLGGIGDEAYYIPGQPTGASPLYVRKGDEGFLLVISGPKIDAMRAPDALAAQTALAQKVLARF